jgi:hypothetical protein
MELPCFRTPGFGGPIPPLSSVMAHQSGAFVFFGRTTFAVTRRAVPDGENPFSGQPEVVHNYFQQLVAARPLAFRSERFPLLFYQRGTSRSEGWWAAVILQIVRAV